MDIVCTIDVRQDARVWIRGFDWDDVNVGHIATHGVAPDEIEEALADDAPLVLRGSAGSYLGYDRTFDGRLLFIVFVRKRRGLVRAITARDMTGRESKLYRRQRGGRR
ncbi:MAG: BrnT family toxin [Candidatus Rokubacteria bacterium]|nr:BrnT family toxin [Candidatus Rokubacteria bacterium]MBI3827824.1 BrnT family toxin [Candidatus Rokubacteria bacterium]